VLIPHSTMSEFDSTSGILIIIQISKARKEEYSQSTGGRKTSKFGLLFNLMSAKSEHGSREEIEHGEGAYQKVLWVEFVDR
jgi:hypothetical protein